MTAQQTSQPQPAQIRVLAVDQDSTIAAQTASVLAGTTAVSACAIATSYENVLTTARDMQPDLVLADIDTVQPLEQFVKDLGRAAPQADFAFIFDARRTPPGSLAKAEEVGARFAAPKPVSTVADSLAEILLTIARERANKASKLQVIGFKKPAQQKPAVQQQSIPRQNQQLTPPAAKAGIGPYTAEQELLMQRQLQSQQPLQQQERKQLQTYTDVIHQPQIRPNPQEVAEKASTALKKIITVYSPKGGSGKTVLAVNIAAACYKLAANAGLDPSIAVVDFDVDFGGVASALLLQDVHAGVTDWPVEDAAVTDDFLRGLMSHYPSGHFDVLPGPESPEMEYMIDAKTTERVIGDLSRLYDIVIVDLGNAPRSSALRAIELCDIPIFITTPTITSLRRIVESTKYFQRVSGTAVQKLRKAGIVLNRAYNGQPVADKEIEAWTGMHILAKIPEDEAIPQAEATGQTVVSANPASPAAKEIVSLVAKAILDSKQLQPIQEKKHRLFTPRRRAMHG